MRRNIHIVPIILFMTFMIGLSPVQAAVAPDQPPEGPGGADYTCSKVIKTVHGSDDLTYYLFEPDGPRPETAPVIVFIHGWGGSNPDYYDTWIEHLVRKGNIVIYPVYQSWSSLFTSNRYTSNCIQAIVDAIELLQNQAQNQAQDQSQNQGQGHPKADLDKFAVVGHSVGGILALNVAALARQSGLPVPKAIMSVEPRMVPMLSMEDLSAIPSRTLFLVVAADRDFLSADDSVMVFRSVSRVPFENKDFIIIISDNYGQPSLIADHLAPTCNATGSAGFIGGVDTNALDYYGTWKLFDALTDAAFYGTNREYALGNTPQQRYMGNWSDGTPVKELVVTDRPRSRQKGRLTTPTPRSRYRERQSMESEHQGGS
ncbi:MAG: alpha/beta hydrolase [bacterium]